MAIEDDVLGPVLTFTAPDGQVKLTHVASEIITDLRNRLQQWGYMAAPEDSPSEAEAPVASPEPQLSEPIVSSEEMASAPPNSEPAAVETTSMPSPSVATPTNNVSASTARPLPSAGDVNKSVAGPAISSGGALNQSRKVASSNSKKAAAPQTSALAIVSLALGLASIIFCFGPITGIPAAIVGHMAKREIQNSDGKLTGSGLASAGFWMGILTVIFFVLFILIIIAGMIADAA